MLAKKEFLLMTNNAPEAVPQAKRFRRSIVRTFILQYLPQRQYQPDREREARIQKEILAELAEYNSISLRKLRSRILLAEAKLAAQSAREKISEARKYAILYDERLDIYADFFRVNSVDQKRFRKIAERYVRMRECMAARSTKKGWKIGLGIAAVLAAAGTAATLYYSKEEKK